VEAGSAAACNVSAFGFRKAPETPRISAMAMIGKPKAAPPAPKRPQENTMDLYKTRAALVAAIAKFQQDGGTQDEIDKIVKSAVALDAKDALPSTGALALALAANEGVTSVGPRHPGRRSGGRRRERTRVAGIRALGTKHKLPDDFITSLVDSDTSLAAPARRSSTSWPRRRRAQHRA
jgi:hypothetical protein